VKGLGAGKDVNGRKGNFWGHFKKIWEFLDFLKEGRESKESTYKKWRTTQ
jgi:hypothetical protein